MLIGAAVATDDLAAWRYLERALGVLVWEEVAQAGELVPTFIHHSFALIVQDADTLDHPTLGVLAENNLCYCLSGIYLNEFVPLVIISLLTLHASVLSP